MGEVDWEARATEIWRAECKPVFPKAAIHEDYLRSMLQLGREMADARAEEIAQAITAGLPKVWFAGNGDGHRIDGMYAAASIARSTITKPKTREQVLDAALRAAMSGQLTKDAIRKALEWKP